MKIIVIGAGISGLAAAYKLQQAGHEVLVLEAANQPGGRCTTLRHDGFIIDMGPEIASTSYKRWLALGNEVGLGNDVVQSSPVMTVLRDGRMIDVDATRTISALFTPALSWSAKLHFARGLFAMRDKLRRLDGDHLLAMTAYDDPLGSAEDLAVATFGREAAEYIIDPLMRILGGSKMSTVSSLIVYYALAGWADPMITLLGGLDRLPKAVAAKLNVTYRANVRQVHSGDQGVSVDFVDANGNASTLTADKCLITAQFDDALRLYPRFAELSGDYGQKMNFASLLDVKLGYGKPTASRALVALIPTIENKEILMFSLTHNKAPDRAPAGHSLFTLYSEHFEYKRLTAMSVDQIISWARNHIENYYPELSGSFLFGHVERQPRTVCFSQPGYYHRTAALWDNLAAERNVYLGGDMMNGGSMEAAMVGGERTAQRLMENL